VDANGNVYVAGYETVAGGGTEMVLIKYAPGPFVKKQANGSLLLQAAGSPGQTFDFRASTNLQTWQDLAPTPPTPTARCNSWTPTPRSSATVSTSPTRNECTVFN